MEFKCKRKKKQTNKVIWYKMQYIFSIPHCVIDLSTRLWHGLAVAVAVAPGAGMGGERDEFQNEI